MGDYMERKRIEVEAKFPLINKKYTVEKLEEVASNVEKTKQKDIYYTPAHENFLKKIQLVNGLDYGILIMKR